MPHGLRPLDIAPISAIPVLHDQLFGRVDDVTAVPSAMMEHHQIHFGFLLEVNSKAPLQEHVQSERLGACRTTYRTGSRITVSQFVSGRSDTRLVDLCETRLPECEVVSALHLDFTRRVPGTT